MQFEITRRFGKQVNQCGDKSISVRVAKVIGDIHNAKNLSEIRNLKKLRGAKDFYRIRMGDYRIGLAFIEGKVVLAAFDHRSDIYKYFP